MNVRSGKERVELHGALFLPERFLESPEISQTQTVMRGQIGKKVRVQFDAALVLSSLRFSNGRTAIDFFGAAAATMSILRLSIFARVGLSGLPKVNEQLGVADDVDEKNVPDLERKISV